MYQMIFYGHVPKHCLFNEELMAAKLQLKNLWIIILQEKKDRLATFEDNEKATFTRTIFGINGQISSFDFFLVSVAGPFLAVGTNLARGAAPLYLASKIYQF
ncbi:unnamed protein product [Adineta steineri]|uniref:Uncharacterized protein n=1 Tax=Adineta steineri TaxID=433720 RepID=A0A813VI82_9BILA|nr:unnamed protein product [Adineta steineri]